MAQGEYSRIQHGFWRDPDIKRPLAPVQKCLLLYYFSAPGANLAGLYYCPLETAAAETGIALEDVRRWTFGELAPFVSYDEATEEVLVHRSAEHKLGVSVIDAKDKRLKALLNLLGDTHSTALRRRFWELHPDWPIGPCPDGSGQAPSKPLASPFEAPSKPIQFISSHNNPEVTDADDKSSEPPARSITDHRKLQNEAAELIRQHLWLGSAPPEPGWEMANELSIWARLAKQHGAGNVNGAITVCRKALRLTRAPLTMKLFNARGHRNRLQDAVRWWQQENLRRAADPSSAANILAGLGNGGRSAG